MQCRQCSAGQCPTVKALPPPPAADIAGLVKGAAEGAGLGNAFLSNITSCDGVFHVVRAFDDDEVPPPLPVAAPEPSPWQTPCRCPVTVRWLGLWARGFVQRT